MQKIFYNGNILTMEQPLVAEAVLVVDDIIESVGALEEILKNASPDAEKIDLMGKTMLPAFLDAHSHFSAAANAKLQIPLEEAVSFVEIGEKIEAFRTKNAIPNGHWLIAKGYDHNALVEKRHPDRHLLDRYAPNHPLVLQHKSGHVGVFNSKALELLNVSAQTPVPAGGVIEQKNGELTGYMEEAAFLQYLKQTPMPDMGALLAAFGQVQKDYASFGITTIQEGMMVQELIPLYEYLLGHGLLELDVVGYADVKSADQLLAAFPNANKRYDRGFKLGGYKIFLDGSPQGRTAWMQTPYADDPSYRGYPTMHDDEVASAVEQAASSEMQLLAHCNGDAASRQYIDAVKTVGCIWPVLRTLRPVLIHGQLLRPDQLSEVREQDIIPSFFIAHVYHWGDVHIENFGFERACSISPAASAHRLGIPFTFHQDTPVIAPDMFETIWCAVTRTTKGGAVLGEEEKISVLEALKAVTINAAYQYFEENEKGSIKAGKYADFIIVDENPLAAEPDALRGIQVLETIKRGKTIYHKEQTSL